MNKAPGVIEVFDKSLVRKNRERAFSKFADHDFLFTWAWDQISDRLQDVKRDFDLALCLGTRGLPHDKIKQAAKIGNLISMDMAVPFLIDKAIQADEEMLPFAENSIDLVISTLGLHNTNDLPGALIQINRALKPDGLFIAAMLGGETLFELRDVMAKTEIKHRGGMSPHVAPFADKQQMGSLMQRARFALPVVDSEIITVTYGSLRKLLNDIRFMGEGNNLADRNKTAYSRAFLNDMEELYKEKYAEEDGRLKATFEVIFLIGWAPHESQQKPLRPGSAENRLADALKTEEIKTGIKTSS